MLEGVSADQRRTAILAEIAALGPVLPGSITQRATRCRQPAAGAALTRLSCTAPTPPGLTAPPAAR